MADESREERLARMNQFVDDVVEDANTMAAYLYAVMERVSSGNPRLLKLEREALAKEMSNMVDLTGVLARLLIDYSNIYNTTARNLESGDRIHALDKKIRSQHLQLFRAIREMLIDDRVRDALELLDKLIEYDDKWEDDDIC